MAGFPASVVTFDGNIQHIQNIIYYQRKAIENLKGHLCTYPLMERQSLPHKNGTTMQFYMNSIFPANVTPITEGTPFAPRAHGGSIKNTVSVVQYADYMTFSDWIEDTAISDIVAEQAAELGFQAARSVDTMNYTQWDATAAAITAARIDLAGSNTTPEYMTRATALRATTSLEAQDVKRKEGGLFGGIMHPLVSYDYANDNTQGGVLDILKYNDYGRIKKGVVDYQVLTLDGIRWVSSTQVPTTANYLAGGQTAYHSYVVGKNAFFCISLDATRVPNEQNFEASVARFRPGQSPADPAGLIKSAAYYKFDYATYVPPDGIARFRRIRSEVSIS